MGVKERIIESAYELFSIKGYEKATIGEIIKKADCSKGGFYHHFKSKEEILEVIITNYISDFKVDFKTILADENGSFIERFNNIYKSISQIKIKQLKEWSKVKNVFIFPGNDRIIRQIEKQFKRATTKTYLKVLQDAQKEGVVQNKNLEILAELCTREVLWINESVNKLLLSEDPNEYLKFQELLSFCEELVSYALGVNKNSVKFKDTALEYLEFIQENYSRNEELS